MCNIGVRIKELRTKMGLSQTDLANLMGIANQSVFKLEAGINVPSFSSLKKLSLILNCSTDYLLFDDYPSEDFNVPRDIKDKIIKILDKFNYNIDDLLIFLNK